MDDGNLSTRVIFNRKGYGEMKRNYNRTLVLLSTMTIVLLSNVPVIADTAQPASSSRPMDDCTKIVPYTSYPIDGNGERISHPTSDSGHVYLYRFPGGGQDIKSTVPPSGWDPRTAPDKELRLYGLRPKPKNPDALRTWNAKYRHGYHRSVPTFCVHRTSSQKARTERKASPNSVPGANNETSSNWSGVVSAPFTVNHEYEGVQEDFIQPEFADTCTSFPVEQHYAIWTGMGGRNGDALIQAGTDIDEDLNPWAWWEGIAFDGADTRQVEIGGMTINPDDQVEPEVSVFADEDGLNPEVFMTVYDVTTGDSGGVGPLTELNDEPISNYITYAYGEFITERVTRPKGSSTPLSLLAEPAEGKTTVTTALVNWDPLYDDGITYLDMTEGGTVLADMRTPVTQPDISSFENWWDNCGTGNG